MTNRKSDDLAKKERRKGGWKVVSYRTSRIAESAFVSSKLARHPKTSATHDANSVPFVSLTKEEIAKIDDICASPAMITSSMRDAIERYRKNTSY